MSGGDHDDTGSDPSNNDGPDDDMGAWAILRTLMNQAPRWRVVVLTPVVLILLLGAAGIVAGGIMAVVDVLTGNRGWSLDVFWDVAVGSSPILIFALYRYEMVAVIAFILFIGAKGEGSSDDGPAPH